MQKLAVFDVDGTLFDGNLGIELLKVLIANKIFNDSLGRQIFDWYAKYKNGEVDRAFAVDEIYKLYAKGMVGVDSGQINILASQTFNSVKPRIFSFSPGLISLLKSHDYKIMFLSGSPLEMIKELAEYFHVDKEYLAGGELEVKNGKFTGNIVTYPGSSEEKVKCLTDMLKNLSINPDLSNSFGMGDNERDSGVLNLVGHPVLLNPDNSLKEKAKDLGWQIATPDSVLSIFQNQII